MDNIRNYIQYIVDENKNNWVVVDLDDAELVIEELQQENSDLKADNAELKKEAEQFESYNSWANDVFYEMEHNELTLEKAFIYVTEQYELKERPKSKLQQENSELKKDLLQAEGKKCIAENNLVKCKAKVERLKPFEKGFEEAVNVIWMNAGLNTDKEEIRKRFLEGG